MQAVIDRKNRMWGRGDRQFSPQRSAKNVQTGAGNPPSMAMLKWAAYASDSELINAASSRDPDYGFLYYK